MATVKKTTTPAKTSYNPFGGGNLIGNVKLPAVAPLPKVNLTTPKISSGGTIPVGTNLLNNKVANQVSKGAFVNVGASQGNAGYNPTTGKYGIQSGSQVTSQRVATPSGTSITPTSTSTPLTSVSGSQIQPATDINLMGTNPNEYLKDYSLEVPGAVQPQERDLGKTQKQQDDVLQQMLDSINNVPSSEDAYKRAQQETQILQKQQAVNDLTGQLNTIVNNGEALKLSLVGQGRGIPEAIIGGQQAQIARETAIQALPIQAQLSAAQGNLEMANDSLDRLFKIYSDDATNRYNARNKSLEAISGFLDKKEQRLWDEQKIQNERAYKETQDLHDEQSSYAKMAFANGQSSLGAKIAQLDYKSPTFKQDLAKLQSQLKDPVQTAQLEKLNAEINKLNKETSGGTVGGVNEDLTAYASQYSDTGKLPSPAELKLSGLSVGQVTTFAKQIPKSKGAVVSIQTGTKSNSISAEAEKDFQKLYNVVEMTKRLKELDEKRIGGVVSGTLGAVFGSEAQGEYLTLRKAIVDEMSRMQSGAALTPEEIAVYNDYLPGRFSESFGLGQDSYKKISNFETTMNQKLQNRLANNGLAVYGYTTVPVGGVMRTVGEIVDINGVNYRVLPDGTLSDIL